MASLLGTRQRTAFPFNHELDFSRIVFFVFITFAFGCRSVERRLMSIEKEESSRTDLCEIVRR